MCPGDYCPLTRYHPLYNRNNSINTMYKLDTLSYILHAILFALKDCALFTRLSATCILRVHSVKRIKSV